METLSKDKFYKFLFNYQPLRFEEFDEEDPRFNLKKRYVNYALKDRDRFYITLKYVLKHLSVYRALTILELGVYPGTMLRILREFLPENKFELYGVGLCVTPDFIRIMREKIGAIIAAVNLDPENEQLKNKNYPNQIPLKNESIDFVFVPEIIEHLTSPVHMLCEARRVLKKGGKIFITTPNVTRIGSVFKLLVGKSNFDCLIPIDYYNENDEWRPHFREYSIEELASLLGKVDFKVLKKVFFNANETYFNVKTIKQRLIDFSKIPFYCIPHLRGNILIIGKKLK